jgi:soluble lytic murein transglycosylase-like protein
MQKFNVYSPRSTLLLASALSLGIALSGCTSVEYSGQNGGLSAQLPDDDANALTATAETTGDAATEVAASGAVPQDKQEAGDATSAATALAPQSAAANGAAAAITEAAQVTPSASAGTQQAAATATATTPLKSNTVALVDAAFPPRPGPPSSPSAAEVPLTLEMMQVQSIIPLQKPRIPELAYAAAPQNAALAALAENDAAVNRPAGPYLRGKDQLQALISKYSKLYDVPEALVHRVVHRESRYDPSAYSKGNYGLMQIRLGTAKGLGFQGTTKDLFDAETNLKYAVKYLRGAYLVADNNHDQAVRLYARGYYYDAKRKGMLHVMK